MSHRGEGVDGSTGRVVGFKEFRQQLGWGGLRLMPEAVGNVLLEREISGARF